MVHRNRGDWEDRKPKEGVSALWAHAPGSGTGKTEEEHTRQETETEEDGRLQGTRK